MAKRSVYRVVLGSRKPRAWNITRKASAQEPDEEVVFQLPTKKEAVHRAIQLCYANQPSQLYIHKMDGRIQEERTYPRSSDPPETPG